MSCPVRDEERPRPNCAHLHGTDNQFAASEPDGLRALGLDILFICKVNREGREALIPNCGAHSAANSRGGSTKGGGREREWPKKTRPSERFFLPLFFSSSLFMQGQMRACMRGNGGERNKNFRCWGTIGLWRGRDVHKR